MTASRPERENYQEVVLPGRLQEALVRINPTLPQEALGEAFRQLTRPDQPSLLLNNHALHQRLVEGIPVDYKAPDGRLVSGRVWAIDWRGCGQ